MYNVVKGVLCQTCERGGKETCPGVCPGIPSRGSVPGKFTGNLYSDKIVSFIKESFWSQEKKVVFFKKVPTKNINDVLTHIKI